MAGKFMLVKRVVIPIMSVIILASQLTGCAALNSKEFLETVNEVDEVIIEVNDIDRSSSGSSSDAVKIGDKAYAYDFNNQSAAEEDEDPEIGVISENKQQLQEITHDELIAVFEKEYELSKSVYDSDSEDTIQGELLAIKFTVDSMDKSLPSDYEAQYRAWRPSVAQQQDSAQAQAQAQAQALTFTEVNEAVWATGTVNLRSGPSTNDEKVGSLSKGNSVTRTGIGTGDYADWSKVKLADGSEVYVASSYLTTTKPTTQTGGGSTQTQNTSKPAGVGTIQGQGSSSWDNDPGLAAGEAVSGKVITDPSQIDTDTSNPYSGYGEISIGYGQAAKSGSGSGIVNPYMPGGVKQVGGN